MSARVYDAYAETIKARKAHPCEGDMYGRHQIKAGDTYVRNVLFPGDTNSSDRPWVMRICVECWRQYDAERPLP